MNDLTITPDEVRSEKLASVSQRAHWLYMAGVIGLGFLAMLLLIAWLGAQPQ